MNKEQQQIIDEVYENYLNEWAFEKYPNDGSVYSVEPIKVKEHTKEQFVYRCKTDSEFSEKWGLKIEERELSLEERMDLSREKRRYSWTWQNWSVEEMEWRMNNDWNIPTKLITLTYNNEKIESYE